MLQSQGCTPVCSGSLGKPGIVVDMTVKGKVNSVTIDSFDDYADPSKFGGKAINAPIKSIEVGYLF